MRSLRLALCLSVLGLNGCICAAEVVGLGLRAVVSPSDLEEKSGVASALVSGSAGAAGRSGNLRVTLSDCKTHRSLAEVVRRNTTLGEAPLAITFPATITGSYCVDASLSLEAETCLASRGPQRLTIAAEKSTDVPITLDLCHKS